MNAPAQTITITRPDDWHLHVRDGAAMHSGRAAHGPPSSAARSSCRTCKPAGDHHASPGPGLPPSASSAAVPAGMDFDAADGAVPDRQHCPQKKSPAPRPPVWSPLKLYPAGATTNSDAGVTDIRKTYATLEAMQTRRQCCCWCTARSPSPAIDIFDREAVFIDQVMTPLRKGLPRAEGGVRAHHHQARPRST